MQLTKTDTRKIICFSPEKHKMFKAAETSSDAFMLKNSKMQPGKDGKMEIKVFREAELQQSTTNLHFTKEYKTHVPTEEALNATVTLSQLETDYQMGSINVKFLGFLDKDKTVFTKYGERTVSIGVVADTSTAKKLTVWSADLCNKLKTGEFYKMTSVQNKLFDNEMQINTTSSTNITPIPSFEGVSDTTKDIMKEKDLNKCEFMSISVQTTRKCKICKKTQGITDNKEKIFRCQACKYKQLVTNLESNTSVSGYVKDDTETRKISIPHTVLHTFLSSQNKLDILSDNDALEDYLLLNPPYNITVSSNGELVSKMSSPQENI